VTKPTEDARRTTAYDRGSLRRAYGDFEERTRTFEVSPDRYERLREEKARAALGGARVLVVREGETLLVSNRGEPGWDVPGGAREPGEAPETTALREVREEVSLSVELRDLLLVTEFGFVPDSRDDERVWGLWPIFEGIVVGDGEFAVQSSELRDAGWFGEPPAELNDPAGPLIEAALAD